MSARPRAASRVWLTLCSTGMAGGLAGPTAVAAHDVDVTAVARVLVDEIGERRYLLSVVDAQVPRIEDPAAVLPAACAPLDASEVAMRIVSGFAFECSRPLSAEDVLILPWRLAGVVVSTRWRDGSGATAYFRGRGGTVPVRVGELRAGAGTRLSVAGSYFLLGGEHILLGWDHLLFVLGLLLLVNGWWTLVKTVTAFTVAHSITLGASALGLIPLDRAPIEAAIALSIVLLAREIVVAGRGRVHLTHAMPWLVAFVFGLLHGLGFAGALSEIGLPSGAIPLALLFFNVGVEAGQLLFVLALAGVHALAGRLPALRAWLPRLHPVMGYAIGALATFWFFDRLPAVWGG